MKKYPNELTDFKLVVKSGRTIHILNKQDIKWIKAAGNYTTLILNENKRLVSRISLEELSNKLELEKFIRIHKSYIINMTYINQLNKHFVLIGNDRIPVGRVYQHELSALFAVQIL